MAFEAAHHIGRVDQVPGHPFGARAARRWWRAATIAAALAVVGCFRDSTGPQALSHASLSLAPAFTTHAARVVEFDQVRVVLYRVSGAVAVDTFVAFPDTADEISLTLSVPLETAGSETFSLTLAMIQGADTVFRGGPLPVTVTVGVLAKSASVPLRYSGVGANAASLAIGVKDTWLTFADSVTLTAVASDSAGQPIPGTPIEWETPDSTKVRLPSATSGKIVALSQRGVARIIAETPTGLADTARVTVQPAPTALNVVSGAGQSAAVGMTLAQPVVLRAKAADGLGVRGVAVNLAAAGGGTVPKATDTTDANGDISVVWTLGNTVGTQTLTATLAATPSITATATATGIAGTPRKLAFQVQPSSGAAGVALSPAVQVVAQDTFGNLVPTYPDIVTVWIGTNPSGATLGGTLNVRAVAGVATFADLTVNLPGTGYTLVAGADGMTAAVSAPFNVTIGAASQLTLTTQPSASAQVGVAFAQQPVVQLRDAAGNAVPQSGIVVSAAIASGGGTLSGATTATTDPSGAALFTNLAITGLVGARTLTFTATGLAAATSATIAVSAGAATKLVFTTEPPTTTAQTAFGVVVEAQDAGGNVVPSFTGAVSVALATNPAGGTLSGTPTATAVAGVASFSGLAIDNIGAGYALSATANGLTPAASAAFSIIAALNVNAWVNAAGGTWSTAANWSRGTVPVATDTVQIKQSGTYVVTVDVDAAFARLDVGAPSGTQTLSVTAGTLTAGNGAFGANTVLDLGGTGTIAGAGTLSLEGAFNWTGGNFNGGGNGGAIRVLPGGTLNLAPTAGVLFQNYEVELAGSGNWTGSAPISGSNAVLRVAAGGLLDLSGDPSLYNNGYYPNPPAVNVVGTLKRTASAGVVAIGGTLNDSGTVSVQTGTLRLGGGGTSTGVFDVASGATLDFAGGTHTLGTASSITGPGTVSFTGGSTAIGGRFAVTSPTLVAGGTVAFNGTADTTGTLTVASGTLGGSGVLAVTGSMTWTGGSLIGSAGKLHVLPGATLSIALPTGAVFQNYALELGGAGTWTGSTAITGSNAVLRVASGATLDIQGDPSFANDGYYPTPPALNVIGTLNRTTSTGVAFIGGTLNDSGAVNVAGGALQLAGGGASTGTFNVAFGATLAISGGTHTLTASSKVRGGGTVNLAGGSTIVDGGWAVAGSTLIAGGTAAFNGALDSAEAVVVSSGTLGGAGVLTVVGSMSWTGGSLNGSAGKVHVIPGATLSIAPAAGVLFQNYTIELDGRGTWTGNAAIAASNALVRVGSTSTLDIQGDASLNNNGYYPNPPAVDVIGVLKRSGSTGIAVLGGPLNDSGTVSVESGTLRLAGGGTSTGAYAVAAGDTLDFGGGTHALTASSSVTGQGTVTFSGGTVNVAGGYAPSGVSEVRGGTANFNGTAGPAGGLTLASGTLGGSGLLTLAGPLTWTGGGIKGGAGTLRVLPNGTTDISPAGGVQFQNYTLDLGGNGVWAGSATITGSNAVMRVSGLLDSRGDPSLTNDGYYPNPPAVNVIGSLARTISGGVATIGGPLNDSGTVSVQTGTLRLAGGGSGGTGFAVQPGATLDLAGGTWTTASNMAWSFGGSLKVSGGSLVVVDRVSVGEDFATAGSGVLVMMASNDSLGVRRNVTFGGGSSSGTLASGRITVGRNFTQTGTGAVFAPTGTAVWLIGDTTFQTIQLADPANSRFYDLQLSPMAWDTVRLLSDVTVGNTLMSSGYTEVVSATTERLSVNGTLDMTMDNDRLGFVHPFVLEVQNLPTLASGYYSPAVSPDTLVFLGAGGYDLPYNTPIQYNHVRIAAAQPISWNCGECNGPLGDVVVGGTGSTYGALRVAYYSNLNIAGKLKTEGQGVLMMDTSAYMYVGDSAIFAGGSTAGLLTGGNLELYGDLHVPVPGAFAPSGSHLTDFILDGLQTIYFAAPDTAATASHFNMLYTLKYNSGLQFLSSAHVLSDLQIVGELPVTVTGPSGDSLTSFGTVWLQAVRFDSLSVVTKIPQGGGASVGSVTFGDYDPAATQFYFEHPGDAAGGAITLGTINFLTPLIPEDPGWHFVANDVDGVSPFLIINLYANWPPPDYYSKVDARNGATVRTAF